jgi:non-ribosomal peptide synthetase component F
VRTTADAVVTRPTELLVSCDVPHCLSTCRVLHNVHLPYAVDADARAPAAACRCGASSGSAVCTVARGYLRRPELTSERFVFIVAPVGAVGVFFNGLIAHV